MKLIQTFAVSSAALFAAAPAFAGGLSAPVIEPVVTPVIVAPVIVSSDWTGAYVGAQLGYADYTLSFDGGDDDDDDDDELSVDGYNIGVYGGYLYDLGSVVLGAELGYTRVTLEADDDLVDEDVDIDVLALSGRVGYDAGAFLPYLKLGYFDASDADDDDADSLTGFLYGLGVDYALSDNFLVGAEYVRHDVQDVGDEELPDGLDATIDTFSIRATYQF